MNTLQINYQAVIEHVTADMEALQKSGQPADKANLKLLQKNCDWLACRRDALEQRRTRVISGFYAQLEGYLRQCENFWKEKHGRTYEVKMDELLEVKKQVTKIYSLTGYDACYALMLAIKPMRSVLPLRQYDEYAPALDALEAIKKACYEQMGTYIKI